VSQWRRGGRFPVTSCRPTLGCQGPNDPTDSGLLLTEGRVMTRRLTALIEREGDGYVALCPELDIASQGDSIEHARDNLREALELFFEMAPAEEIDRRLSGDLFVTHVEVAVG
jgi:predicted RNase H-like HicB family nuclease